MIRTYCISLATVVMLALLGHTASANDALAVVSPAGIAFQKSAAITMQSEDLYISKDSIIVRYTFVNTSNQDVEGTVSFPLPPLDSNAPYARPISKRVGEAYRLIDNPLDFTLLVDGKEKPVQTLDQAEGDCGNEACIHHLNYYWTQKFPAHQTVRIEHHYQTGYGTGVDGKTMARDYCIDAPTMHRLQQTIRAQHNQDAKDKQSPMYQTSFPDYFNYKLYFSANLIEYILQTAKHWHGPIGHFKLTIDKGTPDTMMQLCWPGQFKKISPTQFVFEQDNFVPNRDLKIMLFSPH